MPANAEELLDLFEHEAKPNRANWDWSWQEVANLVLPTRDFITKRGKGLKRHNLIFDDTAPLAAVQLASALHGFLYNPAIEWIQMVTQDPALMDDDEIRIWLADTTRRILAWFANPASGAAMSSFEVGLDLVIFGTGIELVREDEMGLHFQARQLANFWIIENERGRVTDEFRLFEMTPRDMVKTFSRATDQLDEKVKKQADDKKTAYTDERQILHSVYERQGTDPRRRRGLFKRWASVYIDVETKALIREDGFDENPYLTPRWSKAPEETYGRSPAMDVLPAIKTVNAMARTILMAGELAVNPPIITFDNLKEGTLRTTPGARIYLRAGTRDKPEPMLTGARPDIGEKSIQGHQDDINKAFFADILRLPTADSQRGHPRMTATEIIERRQEGLLILSPVLSRLYAEWLTPRVHRVYRWMSRTGRLRLPIPEQLVGRALRPVFRGPMALAQEASRSQAIIGALNIITPFGNVDPGIWQNFEPDDTVRGIWKMFNAPPEFLRPRIEVRQRRQQQEDAEAAQQQLAAAQIAASAARDAAAGIKDVTAGAAA